MQQLRLVCNYLRRGLLLTVLLMFSIPSARGEVRLFRRVSLGPAERWSVSDFWRNFDRNVIALTPSGDVLMLSARRNGNWELYRARRWNTERASVEQLTLDGYFSTKDERDLDELTTHLFVTKDGAYAVCVGNAWWLKHIHGNAVGNSKADNIVVLVDLATFKIANRIHTKDLDLFDEFQEVRLDANGRILVIGSPLGHSGSKAFVQLAIPSLIAGAKCEYNSVPDKTRTTQGIAATGEGCQKALGAVSLENYLSTDQPIITRDPPFKCADSSSEYCPQPYNFTSDQRFGLGLRTEGHDALFGGWVETRAIAVIFSTKTRSEIGELDLGQNRDSGPLLENVDGRIYLLVLRHSTALSVYEVSGSSD
jgi:hypothetical protein